MARSFADDAAVGATLPERIGLDRGRQHVDHAAERAEQAAEHQRLHLVGVDVLAQRPHRVLVLAATTASGPDQGFTAGSMSVADSEALRMACAEARALFLGEAAARLGVDADEMVATFASAEAFLSQTPT